ncbi:probable caffeoyl-CoA O-methyltransferase 2 [Lingula anatina]|uniref:Probable caffeoyl-CoA O-methyltransferase 2 n=1 Tax=Lingula anatina TaxID=7574 RepID=A0A1S3I2K4_LINAN|nr:probable caffeoyl-CoA O-methyltransferase 2 [Lingula anatina]XP_013392061.1 probable caffeoyl-CoA O-methyltransferase 2 [Lingula anatina]|eukprot:XP_013392060.1 probable caffeoyl-CoA O-methyltransferase 2 [Lingula anatina]
MSDYSKWLMYAGAAGAISLSLAVGYWRGRKSLQFYMSAEYARNSRKSQFNADKVAKYIENNSFRLLPVQKKLIEETLKHPRNRMLGSTDEMQLLQNLVSLIKGKKTLDIGVFTGYSALAIALVLPEDGKVVACDVSDEFTRIGKPFWKEAGVEHKIDLRIAPAVETLQKLVDAGEGGTYDFAFIDADKENYLKYYELCMILVRSGGIIAVDNVIWGGSVADPENVNPSTLAMREVNEYIHADQRVNISMLNIADGVTLCFKK